MKIYSRNVQNYNKYSNKYRAHVCTRDNENNQKHNKNTKTHFVIFDFDRALSSLFYLRQFSWYSPSVIIFSNQRAVFLYNSPEVILTREAKPVMNLKLILADKYST